ncbi:MAG: glyoxalase [Rhodanobacter sp.]|nr:MAG: glyoxalase [Rhodanobacter sp.]
MSLSINNLKPYVPAKNFELSKRFYQALGFAMSDGWGGTADFELNGHAFRLQDYYVQDWANNFMFVIGVNDVEAWHQRALELLNSNTFDGMRIKPPEPLEDWLVLHVTDPSGVLLVFVQAQSVGA